MSRGERCGDVSVVVYSYMRSAETFGKAMTISDGQDSVLPSAFGMCFSLCSV